MHSWDWDTVLLPAALLSAAQEMEGRGSREGSSLLLRSPLQRL